MRKLQQTRLHNPPEILGNCFPTVIACFLDLNSPENVIQIQEKYKEEDWNIQLQDWLEEKGWAWKRIEGHLYDGRFYTVVGDTNRGSKHICIYQNGELYHDPNPSNSGLLSEDYFEIIEELKKECFKCNIEQPLSQYYKHPQMGDGRLNKCKTCTKKDTKKQTEINTSTPEGLEKERKRNRDKYHRLGYKEKHKPTKEDRYKGTKKYREKYPEKHKARNASQKISKNKGNHLHHWSYNEKHWKDVIELDFTSHAELHRFLIYDQESFYYKDLEGNLLDTKEKHEDYIKQLGITTYPPSVEVSSAEM